MIEALHATDARFIIVGDIAAVVHGFTSPRGLLELSYERTSGNYERLIEALAPLQPTLRGAPPDLPFQWDTATLRNGSNLPACGGEFHFTLSTEAGPLDLLGHVSGLGGYAQVKAQAETFELYGCTTWVLSLEGLIQSKEATGRAKDERMLPELRSLQHLRDEASA